MRYDALVVGGGIGGMESALKLGDMGHKVLVVEKQPSVGGKMILLSKVFPTLDCASCISTPKMAATIHHPNIKVLTYAEVEGIRGNGDGTYRARIRQKPKFIDEIACTGCRQCEMACNVAVPDEYNADMVSRRAAYIAFPQAVPKKAVIDRAGVSPCTDACPAGIKAHGYVARVRSGEYEQAFDLVLEATPLVGSLGRACYAPCEGECTRGELEGTLPIRRLKRFIADERYGRRTTDADGARAPESVRPEPNGKRVAVVGSGPAGLTAAWQLARKGYGVKIFEAAPRPGGMLRLGIPAYRLPTPSSMTMSPTSRRSVSTSRRRRASTMCAASRATVSTPCSWRRAHTGRRVSACAARISPVSRRRWRSSVPSRSARNGRRRRKRRVISSAAATWRSTSHARLCVRHVVVSTGVPRVLRDRCPPTVGSREAEAEGVRFTPPLGRSSMFDGERRCPRAGTGGGLPRVRHRGRIPGTSVIDEQPSARSPAVIWSSSPSASPRAPRPSRRTRD